MPSDPPPRDEPASAPPSGAPPADGANAPGAAEPSLAPTSGLAEARRPRRGLPRNVKIGLAFACGAAAAVLIVHTIEARAKWEEEAAARAQASKMAERPALAVEEDAGDVEDAGPPDADAASAEAAAPQALPPVWRVSELKGDASLELVEATLGKRPFSTALLAAGVPRAELARIAHAFEHVRSFDRVGQKDTFVVAKEKKSGHVVAFEFSTSPAEVWQARETSPGVLEGKKLDLIVERIRVAAGVLVEGDLRTSLTKAGLDDDLLNLLDDALEGHADLADLRAGARLRVVATEERVQGKFTRYAELDALEYTPPAGAPQIRVYFQPTGKASGYYDAKWQRPFRGGFKTPVPLARISSRFNPRRMHPVLKVVMPHNGIDFAAPPGTPVYASASGTVSTAGDSGPCGNMVQIKHPSGLVTAYCHLQRFAAGIHAGLHIEQRQLLGYVGQTGRATGPHLHFAVKRGEAFLDPLALKLDGVRVLPPEDRDEFSKSRVELDGALDGIAFGAPPPDAGAAVAAVSVDAGAEDLVLDEAP